MTAAAPLAVAVASDWTGYLGGPAHTSASPETAITPANAASLTRAWLWTPPAATGSQPAAALNASPTVASGRVFIGSNTGVFYALSETTGKRLWSRNLGHTPSLTCSARGITSTATVAPDPSRGGTATVYVSGGAGKLFALDASTGAVVWKRQVTPVSTTENAYYAWSSPTLAAGHIYLGLASQCDSPLVRGGVVEIDQSTGQVLRRYWAIGAGKVGASVWTSVAATADGSRVFATTGNGDEVAGHDQGDSYAIVRLDGGSMARQDIWTVPASDLPVDSDFGGSPTLFSAQVAGVSASLVAACNKNGVLYAWRAGGLAAGPLWRRRIDSAAGPNCLAAPIAAGGALYQAGGATTIGGTAVKGAVRRLDPATGAIVWQTGIGAQALGSASADGAGVIAVPGYDGSSAAANGVYLLDSATGTLLGLLGSDKTFAQPVFANGRLLVATVSAGLSAYAPG
ncbi:MAG: hypothetical protein QOF08_1076 [Gaiellales bacterium]|jgi:outer membrane protein assembly factor BamB|nr:hypothetical protein [Gaiellales bacterium]